MKWIWTEQTEAPSFAEFRLPFDYADGKVTLKISAEYRYIAYVNGSFAANGQYTDIPEYKIYDEVDITRFVKIGANELRVQAFHMGMDGMTVRFDIPCAAFEVYCDGKLIAASSENTDCRELPGYSAGPNTTPMLGRGFNFDFTAAETEWHKATVKDTGYNEVPRLTKKTKVEKETLGKVTAQGVFMKNGGKTHAVLLQECWMKTVFYYDMTGTHRVFTSDMHEPVTFKSEEGDGIFVIVDLGRESTGYPRVKVNMKESCQAYICWGEHLQDLRIRSSVGPRNFAYGLKFKEGENEFTEYFRRIAGRYMGLYVESGEVTLEKLGMIEDEYPLDMPEKDFGDRLLNKIYEVSRRTMELCIHDHYEDCPWREQALYAGDSRLQMLYGYGAFGEHVMPRESLRMMAICIEDDGLIPLTAPSRINLNIPSGSFCWIVALYEYVKETDDIEFLKEMLPYAEKVMGAYERHTADNAIQIFSEQKYWNFHEWTQGLNGRTGGTSGRPVYAEPEHDGLMTAYGIFTSVRLAELFRLIGENNKAEKYDKYAEMLKIGLESLYDEKKGLYKSYIDEEDKQLYHVLTNTIALASGAVTDKKRIAHICEVLKYPEKYGAVEMSLPYFSIKYDVLIEHCEDGLDFAIDQICEIFGGMLFGGATSFWETVYGEMDFSNAGSLCHGWAGLSCYVLDKYYKPAIEKNNK